MILNDLADNKPGAERIEVNGVEYKKGDKLRLKLGKRRSDSMDMLINGRTVTIETIYTDYDDRVYFAVTIDGDPAQELQREMNMYRFFLPDEVEIVSYE